MKNKFWDKQLKDGLKSINQNKMNPLQLRKIELEKGCGKSIYCDAERNCLHRCGDGTWECDKCQAELKGINLGLKVLEDYSQQKTCGDSPTQQQEYLGTNPEERKASKENDKTNADDVKSQEGLIVNGGSLDSQYQKGYQDAIKEVLNKIDKMMQSKTDLKEEDRYIDGEELKQQILEVKQ